jgi:hypothetical protein
MKVTIELAYGPQHDSYVTPEHLQRTIDAIARAASKASAADSLLLTDAASIFRAMQREVAHPRDKDKYR